MRTRDAETRVRILALFYGVWMTRRSRGAHRRAARRCVCMSATRRTCRHMRRTARKKDCDDLLTVEKTVIRFRGNRRPPQKRVSRATTPSRSTTRTSARNITRWMRASSPLRNHTHLIPTSATDVARAGLPFHRGDVVQSTTHPIESGPMRGARRRVCAGPTPACRLRTGPLYMQVH